MNKIFNQLIGLSTKPHREATPRIKGAGKTFDAISELAKSKGLELYADHLCKCYWLWKDGNTIDGTHDPFNTLAEVKSFLKTYNS